MLCLLLPFWLKIWITLVSFQWLNKSYLIVLLLSLMIISKDPWLRYKLIRKDTWQINLYNICKNTFFLHSFYRLEKRIKVYLQYKRCLIYVCVTKRFYLHLLKKQITKWFNMKENQLVSLQRREASINLFTKALKSCRTSFLLHFKRLIWQNLSFF